MIFIAVKINFQPQNHQTLQNFYPFLNVIISFHAFKSAFYSKWMDLRLLILLIIQQLSTAQMFEIAKWLKLTDIINTSWHPLQTYGWNLNHLSERYQYQPTLYTFEALVMLTSLSSETSILSKYIIYDLYKQPSKKTWK